MPFLVVFFLSLQCYGDRGAGMDGAARAGSLKGKQGRKNKKRPSKKRPVSALSHQSAQSGGACSTADRYHCTSFPLVSDLSCPHRLVNEDDSSRMSWCSDDDHDKALDCLPFLLLPSECWLKIFSFLPYLEKGRVARVCRDWWGLTRNPCLWDRVSFSELPQSCLPSASHSPGDQCYSCFRRRVLLFTEFLEGVRPILRYLEFKFDICDSKSQYMQTIERLLAKCACRDLRVAHLNWKETPSEPLWLEQDGMSRCEEVVQKHRFRQRLFIQFFSNFTGLAPRLATLVLPFDWSDNSIASLARLKSLRNLVVEKYFVFQHLPQVSLDRFLGAVPQLRRLLLEVWTPSAHGLLLYAMTHRTLQYLDISQSRGFYLQALTMPSMQRFRVARHPWNGPLVLAEHVNIVCLHTVLSSGAPRLAKINDHYLEPDWRRNPSERLEEVLKGVCSCRKHKTGWAM